MKQMLKTLKIRIVAVNMLFTPCISLADSNAWTTLYRDVEIDVYHLKDTRNLQLFLNNTEDHSPIRTFHKLGNSLSKCENLKFAMNGGMFHKNFTPVGLYIENFRKIYPLNLQKNHVGNFYLEPNGVFAWNKNHVNIYTAHQFLHQSRMYQYAMQSGPLLVLNGEINPVFIETSDSKKIRNGVGVGPDGVYFAITRKKINFYDFADFFKTELKVKQALYLDGSISSLYLPELHRDTQKVYLGPMIAEIDQSLCTKAQSDE